MYTNSNKMVKRMWSERVIKKRVYEGVIISRYKYQSLKSSNEMDLIYGLAKKRLFDFSGHCQWSPG